MKSKLLFFDLIICSIWMLSLFGGRMAWIYPPLIFVILEVMLRFVVSYSLYRKERRSWLPLVLFLALTVLMAYIKYDLGDFGDRYELGINRIVRYAFIVTKLEYSQVACSIIEIALTLWLFILPFVYYLSLLFRKQLERTSLTWKDMMGGILWHDRLTKTCSAVLMVMLTAFLTGLSMSSRVCLLMCLTAAPITYWLLCRLKKVRAERLWMLVIAMCIFWYAQLLAGVWRVSMLIISLGLVMWVCRHFYQETKNCLLSVSVVVYLSILLPSFSIGYNQYACLNYARKGFYYLSPFQGILYIVDNEKTLYGLRDRYGLLIKPEYERIYEGDGNGTAVWSYVYVLQKDDKKYYYDMYSSDFVQESACNDEEPESTVDRNEAK